MDADDFAALSRDLQRAEDLYRSARYREALQAYEDLLRSRLHAGARGCEVLGMEAELVIVERLAHLSAMAGSSEAADALLDGATALCRRAGNGYAAAYFTLMRALLALEQGRLVDVNDRLADLSSQIGDIRNIETTPAGLHAWEARCRWPVGDVAALAVLQGRLYLVLGGLLAALGQYTPALDCLAQGLRHAGTEAPELARSVRSQLELGRVSALLEQGQLVPAQGLLERYRDAAELVAHPGLQAQWLGLAGKLALLAGRYGEALQSLQRLVALAGRLGFDRAQAIAMLNLAQLRIFVNQTAAARALIDQAAALAARARDQAVEQRAVAMRMLAGARGRSLAEAVSIAPSVVDMWRSPALAAAARPPEAQDAWPELPQARSFLDFFEDRALGVQWALGRGDAAAAGQALAAMQDVFGDTDSTLVATRLKVLQGLLAYYQAGPGDAATCARAVSRLAAAADALRQAGLRPELWQVLRVQVWAGTRAGADPALLRAWAEEAEVLLEAMSASLFDAERAIYLLNKWTADEEALAAAIDALVGLRRQQRQLPVWRRPIVAWRIRLATARLLWRIDRHKALATRHTLETMGDDAPGSEVPPSALACWRPWPSDKAMLAMLVLPDRTLFVAARGWRLDFGVSAVTRVQWRESVRQWHSQMQRAVADPDGAPADVAAQLDRLAESLGRMLQLPMLLAQMPAKVRRLQFVPDDVLHGLPFAALRVNRRFVAEDHAVVVDFSVRPPPPDRQRSHEAVLVGVGQACGSYPALPGALLEVAALQPLLARLGWSAEPLVDQSAQRETVLEGLLQAGLLHMACHGVFDPAQPSCSGLVLPGPQGGVELLRLRDLAALDLSSLRHAGLSACWSADNFVLPGRWVVGLPETLRRAGAHCVLAWLWPAPDRYAAALTARFYELLVDHSRAQALQRVQGEAMSGRHAELLPAQLRSLPLWAGLQLYGCPEGLHD